MCPRLANRSTRPVKSRLAVTIAPITIFDSLVAIEKRRRSPPIALARGDGGHQKNPPAMDYIAMRRAIRVPDQGV